MPSQTTSLTLADFIAKWQKSTLSERSAAQSHLIDLCHVLGQPSSCLALGSLDVAAFDAYGWPHDPSDDDIHSRLLALNLERATAWEEAAGPIDEEIG